MIAEIDLYGGDLRAKLETWFIIIIIIFFNNDCLPYNSFLTKYNISQTLSLRSWELKPQARNKTSLLWIPFMLIDMESLSAHWVKKGRNDSKPVQDQQLQTKDSNPKYTAAREKKKNLVYGQGGKKVTPVSTILLLFCCRCCHKCKWKYIFGFGYTYKRRK